MKKLIAGLIAGLMLLGVVGCKLEFNTEKTIQTNHIVMPDGKILISDFDAMTIRNFLKATEEVKDYHILLNTGGGNAPNAITMINRIQNLQRQGAHITTETYGYALSAGAVVFLTGDTRIIHSGAMLMFHCSRVSSFGGVQTQKTEDMEEPMRDWLIMIDNNFAELLKEKTNLTDEEIDRWLFHEDSNFMSAEEAFKIKIATILVKDNNDNG